MEKICIMKKLLTCSLLALIFTSCGPNLSKKAEKLAKTTVVSLLYNPESYEPIQTVVMDSVFTSIYTDVEIMLALDDYNELTSDKEDIQRDYDRAKRDYNSAKSSAAIWSNSFSALAREEYSQAQEELKEAQQKIDEYTVQLNDIDDKIEAKREAIKKHASETEYGEFLGRAIVHRYRCANGNGVKFIREILIIADKNIDKVLYRFSLDETDEYSLHNIQKLIDSIVEN